MVRNLFKSFLGLKGALLVLVAFLCFPISALAQNYSPSELDTLVSSIALYPDPLLVHVLTASTYGNELPAASAWAEGHKHLKGESLSTAIEEADLPYDPSVQALLPFPSVLSMMAKYGSWTDQLGDAVTQQKDDVMEAIQRMRQSAYDHGHLKTNEQVTVQETSGNIAIEPVKTEVIYVPVYNPRVVYYVYADGYTRISYGNGVWLGTWYGEWGWGSCWFDWGPRVIYVRNTRWYAHRPIPRHPHRYRPPPRRVPNAAPNPRLHPGSHPQKPPIPRSEAKVHVNPAQAPVSRKASSDARVISSPSDRRVSPNQGIRSQAVSAPRYERSSVTTQVPPKMKSNAPSGSSSFGRAVSSAPAPAPAPAPSPRVNSSEEDAFNAYGANRNSGFGNASRDNRDNSRSYGNSGSRGNSGSHSSGRSSGGFGKAVRR